MQPFHVLDGRIVVLNQDNIDTDRIMPARYLTRIERGGYGELLFHDVRGASFELDQPEAKGANILVAGTNFGCGSSREHAVWGLQQGGFRAVISKKLENSPGFSDIFRQNSINCGLLLIELPPADHGQVVALGSGAEISIDLPAQTLTWPGHSISFEINPANKETLIKGLDLIGMTLELKDEIADYESHMRSFVNLGK